jgi:L-alanine-DL-glutamate epimerase-like enolase superfamily enzyme
VRGCVLPGGKHRDRGRLFKVISRADPDALAAKLAGYRVESYTRFQMKVGDDPHRGIDRIRWVAEEVRAGDIPVADENTSRKQYEAKRVAAAVRNQIREGAGDRP